MKKVNEEITSSYSIGLCSLICMSPPQILKFHCCHIEGRNTPCSKSRAKHGLFPKLRSGGHQKHHGLLEIPLQCLSALSSGFHRLQQKAVRTNLHPCGQGQRLRNVHRNLCVRSVGNLAFRPEPPACGF